MSRAEDTERCYSGAFHPTGERCTRRGVWTTRLGNMVDRFVWCNEHAPPKEWRVPAEALRRLAAERGKS